MTSAIIEKVKQTNELFSRQSNTNYGIYSGYIPCRSRGGANDRSNSLGAFYFAAESESDELPTLCVFHCLERAG